MCTGELTSAIFGISSARQPGSRCTYPSQHPPLNNLNATTPNTDIILYASARTGLRSSADRLLLHPPSEIRTMVAGDKTSIRGTIFSHTLAGSTLFHPNALQCAPTLRRTCGMSRENYRANYTIVPTPVRLRLISRSVAPKNAPRTYRNRRPWSKRVTLVENADA